MNTDQPPSFDFSKSVNSSNSPNTPLTPELSKANKSSVINETVILQSSKRQLSETSSERSLLPPKIPPPTTSAIKKLKANSFTPNVQAQDHLQSNTAAILQKEKTKNPLEYPYNFNQLNDFFSRCRTNKNIQQVVTECNLKADLIVQMMRTLYPMLESETSKSSFTRLIKKLEAEALNDDATSECSLSSSSSLMELDSDCNETSFTHQNPPPLI